MWTNESLTPKETLYEVSRNLIDLFIHFLHAKGMQKTIIDLIV